MESQGAEAGGGDVARSRPLGEARTGIRGRRRRQVSGDRNEIRGDPLPARRRAVGRDEGAREVLDVLQRAERADRDLRRSYLVDAAGGREWAAARGAFAAARILRFLAGGGGRASHAHGAWHRAAL